MTHSPTFNLWSASWITVERPSGRLDTLSLEQTLSEAACIHAVYDPSPLVVVGIHRLLVAILQSAYMPQTIPDLLQIWRNKAFDRAKLAAFAAEYQERFDLFDVEAPFYQSADLPLQPAKGEKQKPVGYLFGEQPTGTAVTHYNHSYDSTRVLCSHCVAKGLLLMPAFASSGGAGIKPSINGVPPMYVLPGGSTLFEALTASLTIPAFQPSRQSDTPVWWQRPLPTIVEKKGEVRRLSYLGSLTFPARRIRLHPIAMHQACTRCAQKRTWGVQTMIYEMGESYTSGHWWRDPFAAYRQRKKGTDAPLPIRPVEGRALWREFRGLFLPNREKESDLTAFRPSILNQIEEIWRYDKTILPFTEIPLRVVGLRTDMKMKIFEWEESGFLIPPYLLNDYETAETVQSSIDFAVAADGIIKKSFRKCFGGDGKVERYATLKKQMSYDYWQQLGHRFQTQLHAYTPTADTTRLFHQWLDTVLHTAMDIFVETTEALPSDGLTLRKRQEAIIDCRKLLYGYRKKRHPRLEEVS